MIYNHGAKSQLKKKWVEFAKNNRGFGLRTQLRARYKRILKKIKSGKYQLDERGDLKFDGYVPENVSNRPILQESWTVDERAKLDDYCLAFNDCGTVIWNEVELKKWIPNRTKIACQEEYRLHSTLVLDFDHVNMNAKSTFFWTSHEDAQLRAAVEVKRMKVGVVKNVINIKHVQKLFAARRTIDSIIMRVRHLNLRYPVDIPQNEIEDRLERNVAKVNCFRLHCSCTITMDHSVYHLADALHVDNRVMQCYNREIDLDLINKATLQANDNDNKIVYIYVREIDATAIAGDDDYLKRLLANSVDYIGEGSF